MFVRCFFEAQTFFGDDLRELIGQLSEWGDRTPDKSDKAENLAEKYFLEKIETLKEDNKGIVKCSTNLRCVLEDI